MFDNGITHVSFYIEKYLNKVTINLHYLIMKKMYVQ
ncbi:hypothetical protein JOC93_001294 [Priestia taiwanensis]|nr:hypothetical protein [Priestia taiwanensis]